MARAMTWSERLKRIELFLARIGTPVFVRGDIVVSTASVQCGELTKFAAMELRDSFDDLSLRTAPTAGDLEALHYTEAACQCLARFVSRPDGPQAAAHLFEAVEFCGVARYGAYRALKAREVGATGGPPKDDYLQRQIKAEWLRYGANGYSERDRAELIAARLHITSKTVRKHVRALGLRKTRT
ncbi:MAG: hypothetical protein RL722_2277 [Pseudomonadota bacterium]|jgi:hypothetical protein